MFTCRSVCNGFMTVQASSRAPLAAALTMPCRSPLMHQVLQCYYRQPSSSALANQTGKMGKRLCNRLIALSLHATEPPHKVYCHVMIWCTCLAPVYICVRELASKSICICMAQLTSACRLKPFMPAVVMTARHGPKSAEAMWL